jgi:predicted HD superfamily hydrolase involved in NAD metabolism
MTPVLILGDVFYPWDPFPTDILRKAQLFAPGSPIFLLPYSDRKTAAVLSLAERRRLLSIRLGKKSWIRLLPPATSLERADIGKENFRRSLKNVFPKRKIIFVNLYGNDERRSEVLKTCFRARSKDNSLAVLTLRKPQPLLSDSVLLKDLSVLKKRLHPHRYLHSLSVAWTAYEIACRNSLPAPEKACLAGLFHDGSKDFPEKKEMVRMQKLFPKNAAEKPFCFHQYLGAYDAKNEFALHDKEILSAISCHCTGKRNMAPLDKALYEADKVEPSREFPTTRLRAVCFRNLDDGLVAVLKSLSAYFRRKGIPYQEHPSTQAMYEEYIPRKD